MARFSFRPSLLFRRPSSHSAHSSETSQASTAVNSVSTSPSPTHSSSLPNTGHRTRSHKPPCPNHRLRDRFLQQRKHSTPADPEHSPPSSHQPPSDHVPTHSRALDLQQPEKPVGSHAHSTSTLASELRLETEQLPVVTLEEATPIIKRHDPVIPDELHSSPSASPTSHKRPLQAACTVSTAAATGAVSGSSSPVLSPIPNRSINDELRRQSIVSSANAKIVESLVVAADQYPDVTYEGPTPHHHAQASGGDPFTVHSPNMANVLMRKVWVRRPGASATLVQIREDDLVDDVRDMILRKYANSLGKTFDAPDMTLRISQRTEHSGLRPERVLGPEEEMCRTIDTYFPGGQHVDDALIIDVPQKRTPRPSPKVYQQTHYQALEDYRPHENGTDYFPPMPIVASPGVHTASSRDSPHGHHHNSIAADQHPKSIAVLSTGQIAPLPSPGGRKHRRPLWARTHTTSPTVSAHPNAGAVAVNPPNLHIGHRPSNTSRPRGESTASEKLHVPNGAPPVPPLPTPPAPEAQNASHAGSTPPTPAGLNPPRPSRPGRISRRRTPDKPKSKHHHSNSVSSNIAMQSTLLDGSVPPINVLIVEDNIINLRILEGLMKRLKVRWQTALNGQVAVDKWKTGGYHLVLMDIQMPVMNGLQATKEIRRLERVNGIGVFSTTESAATSPVSDTVEASDEEMMDRKKSREDDRLEMSEGLFKSPVIIVALTASSLQSDRHEALAAGCNDFLTKPVNFVWLERKVKEWGCMQALIDFDGWRKWKDYAKKEEEGKTEAQKEADKEKEEKQRAKMEKFQKFQEKQAAKRKEEEKKKREAALAAASETDETTTGSDVYQEDRTNGTSDE